MLAGCSSSTLLSPRHRLRSEAPAQFQACHFQLPSMSTQRLDLPCSFPRKDTTRSQSIRPVGLSVEKPIESKTSSCSLKQNIRLPPLATSAPAPSSQTAFTEGRKEIKDEFWERGKSLKKRFAEQGSVDESFIKRAKRKRAERIFEEAIAKNFPNLTKHQSIPLRISKSDKFKEIHPETHYNQIIKNQSQKENLKSNKREATPQVHRIFNEINS